MLSGIAAAAAGVVAAAITVKVLYLAVTRPFWWVWLTVSIVMVVPVALFRWAGTPSWVSALPVVLLLAVVGYQLASRAVELHAALGSTHAPNLARSNRRGGAWWDAPEIVDDTAGTAGDAEVDDAFDELVRRNFSRS